MYRIVEVMLLVAGIGLWAFQAYRKAQPSTIAPA